MRNLFVLCALLSLAACSSTNNSSTVATGNIPKSKGYYKVGSPYKIDGIWYTPQVYETFTEEGIASWYGPGFHGKMAANGETFDTHALTGAHKTLPLPSIVRVTNLENGRSAVVRVNDRGPFSDNRIFDASRYTAETLGFINKGTARVRLELLPEESKIAALEAREGRMSSQYASNTQQPTQTAQPVNTIAAKPLAPIAGYAPLPPREQDIETTVTQNAQPSVSQGIYVQAAAFSTPMNAEKLAAQLKAIDATIIQPTTVSGKTLYRVRLGPYPSLDVADKSLNKVIAAGQQQAQIIIE
jgi:rare lipoprotein A